MMKCKRLWALLLCLCLTVCLCVAPARAAGFVEPERDVSLTLHFAPGDSGAQGVTFRIYKVADVSRYAEFTLTADFAGYDVSLEKLDSAGWKALAQTLSGYVRRDNVTPTDSGKTDAAGTVRFPSAGKTLTAGLYLVTGERFVRGGYTYTPEAFMISLPDLDEQDRWVYDVEARVKYGQSYDGGEGPGTSTVNRRVLKVWKDGEEDRPASIQVQLLRNGQVYDTVELNAANNWRHQWSGLDAGYTWQVVEKEVPEGYTVSVSQEGITFVVTNTETTEIPPEETPGEPTPGGPDEPGPGEPGQEIPDQPTPAGSKLPQTGALWWPVPLLAIGGAVLVALGWARRRSEAYDET